MRPYCGQVVGEIQNKQTVRQHKMNKFIPLRSLGTESGAALLELIRSDTNRYAEKRDKVAKDVCDLAPLSSSSIYSYDAKGQCESEMKSLVDVTVKKWLNVSMETFPERHDPADAIIFDEGLQSYGADSSTIVFRKGFNWDRYPVLHDLKERLEDGPDQDGSLPVGDWTCTKQGDDVRCKLNVPRALDRD